MAASVDYRYLAKRIAAAQIIEEPFPHIEVRPFFLQEDFQYLIQYVRIQQRQSTEDLIKELFERGYRVQEFPGCTENVPKYLNELRQRKPTEGLAFRLWWPKDDRVRALIKYLQGDEFTKAMCDKFEVPMRDDFERLAAIQKYLTGYEISPHPDVRRKVMTWMVNINPHPQARAEDIHTSLMRLRPGVTPDWVEDPSLQRDWLPWESAESVKTIVENNTLVMFPVSDHSLHAVKLDYDHLVFQRTQVYGNLFKPKPKVKDDD